MVAHIVRDDGAAGSSPVTSTKIKRLGRAFFYFGGVTGLEGDCADQREAKTSQCDVFKERATPAFTFQHVATNELNLSIKPKRSLAHYII